MSYYRQQNRYKLNIGHDGNPLVMLIAINLVVFSVLSFIKVIYFFSQSSFDGAVTQLYNKNILNWLILPADLSKLASRPWTIITHMFVHDSVWHILANMLWLWAFGHILQSITGYKRLVPIFLYGALAGAVAFIISYNLLPPLRANVAEARALGASAGIMAVAVATTVFAPGYRVFPMINGGIPLWVITLLFVIIDVATIPYNQPGAHIAHLAGAGMGFLFVYMLRKGHDWGTWINNFFYWVENLFNPDKPKKGKTIKQQLFYKTKVQPFTKTSNLTQQRIDEILDKINQRGYHSLTEDEKELLKRASKEEL
jgi:membrane associated rhomboid family serine protease